MYFSVKLPKETQKIPFINVGRSFAKNWRNYNSKNDIRKNMSIGSRLCLIAYSIIAALITSNKYCSQRLDNMIIITIISALEGTISNYVYYDSVAHIILVGCN